VIVYQEKRKNQCPFVRFSRSLDKKAIFDPSGFEIHPATVIPRRSGIRVAALAFSDLVCGNVRSFV
jgi:hypothetical protein